MEWILVILLLCLGYLYAGYPLLMFCISRLWPKPIQSAPFQGTASILISAKDEVHTLPDKLKSLIRLAPAAGIRDIWVGLDGCSDGTLKALLDLNSIALHSKTFPDRMEYEWQADDVLIGILDFPLPRGKPSVLNDLMPRAAGDIVVMMDARQQVEEDCLPRLLAVFSDPTIGVASTAMCYRSADTSPEKGAQSYWGYEKFVRMCESRSGSVCGATGAGYAIRKELLQPIPPETLVDDVLIPMRAVLQGKRCVFLPDARVWDIPTSSHGAESHRKRRTLAGVLQLLRLEPALFSFSGNPIWFRWMSHKFLRLLTPFFCLGGLVSIGGLAIQPGGPWITLAALAWGGSLFSALTYQVQGTGKRNRLIGMAGAFWMINVVILGAWVDFFWNRQPVRWKTSSTNSSV